MPTREAILLLLVGGPVWVLSFALAVRLQPKLGMLWLLLLAPLIRQFVWVLVPTAIFAFSSEASQLANMLGVDGVTHGAMVVSFGNYGAFLGMLVVLLVAAHRMDPPQCRTSSAMALAGGLMAVVWMFFRLTEQRATLALGNPARFGGSVTYLWGYAGLILVLAHFLPARAGRVTTRTVCTWFAIACAFAGPMLLVGQRMYVIYPLVLASCMALATTEKRPSLARLLGWGLAGMAIVGIAFLLISGIRQSYYWSGGLPPLSQLPTLLASGLQQSDRTLPEIAARTSTIVLTAEAAAAHSGIFPPFGWSDVLGTLLRSLVTPRLIPASALAATAGHQGMAPGAWLAMAFGDDSNSTFTFPPEVAFYLAGGLSAVLLGGLLTGALAAGWIVALQRLRCSSGNILAIMLGVIFSTLVLAELFETVARSLLWNLAITVITLEAIGWSVRTTGHTAANARLDSSPGVER